MLRRKPTPRSPGPARRRGSSRRGAGREQPARYYAVARINLRIEAERLCRLPALGGPDGPLVKRPPELSVRRASQRPRTRMGFAVPDEHRISVTAYPGITRGDVEETLLHELVHLALGSSPGTRRWHGPEFGATLRQAMAEAYGIDGIRPRNSYHGAWAAELERKHRLESERGPVHPGQLELG